jgi:tetratricopeptide (TPR) repeat protein
MLSTWAPKYDAAGEYRVGIEAMGQKRYSAAERAFKRVLSITPRDSQTHYMLGMTRNALNNFAGARKAFEKAVKYDGSMILAWQELAIADARLGDQEKSRAILVILQNQSVACAEKCREAADLQAAIAAIQAALGNKQGSIASSPVSLALSDQSQGDRAYLQAVSLINQKHFEAAIVSLKEAQRAFGPHPDVLTYLGFSHRKLGNFDQAEEYYRQALTAAPGHRGATEYFGELLVERGDLEAARGMLRRLTESCSFGCAEADELGRWIASAEIKQKPIAN